MLCLGWMFCSHRCITSVTALSFWWVVFFLWLLLVVSSIFCCLPFAFWTSLIIKKCFNSSSNPSFHFFLSHSITYFSVLSSLLQFLPGFSPLVHPLFLSFLFCSPHIIFLSQSVLYSGNPGSGENDLSLCGSRMCHEIAHSWFGLVIGARDWTEEWISEGFATYLEDIIWAQAQQVQYNHSLIIVYYTYFMKVTWWWPFLGCQFR